MKTGKPLHHAVNQFRPIRAFIPAAEMGQVQPEARESGHHLLPQQGMIQKLGLLLHPERVRQAVMPELQNAVMRNNLPIPANMAVHRDGRGKTGKPAAGTMRRQRNSVLLAISVQGHQHGIRGGITVGAVQLKTVKNALPSQTWNQSVHHGGNIHHAAGALHAVAGAARIHHVKRKHPAGMRRRQFEQIVLLRPERIPLSQGKPLCLPGQAA